VSDSLKKISAMSLFVENVHEVKSFYQDVFDVQVVHEDEVSVAVKFDNLIINLLQVSEASALVEPGVVGGMRVATFTDPAGHSWEVAQGLDN